MTDPMTPETPREAGRQETALRQLRSSVEAMRQETVAGQKQAKRDHEWGRVDRFEGGEGYLNAVLSDIDAMLAAAPASGLPADVLSRGFTSDYTQAEYERRLAEREATYCVCGNYVLDSSGDAGCGNCGADYGPRDPDDDVSEPSR